MPIGYVLLLMLVTVAIIGLFMFVGRKGLGNFFLLPLMLFMVYVVYTTDGITWLFFLTIGISLVIGYQCYIRIFGTDSEKQWIIDDEDII